MKKLKKAFGMILATAMLTTILSGFSPAEAIILTRQDLVDSLSEKEADNKLYVKFVDEDGNPVRNSTVRSDWRSAKFTSYRYTYFLEGDSIVNAKNEGINEPPVISNGWVMSTENPLTISYAFSFKEEGDMISASELTENAGTQTLTPETTSGAYEPLWTSVRFNADPKNKKIEILDGESNIAYVKGDSVYLVYHKLSEEEKPLDLVKAEAEEALSEIETASFPESAKNFIENAIAKALEKIRIAETAEDVRRITSDTKNLLANFQDASKASVSGIKEKVYTGKPIMQSLSVSINGVVLQAGKDYAVSYKNNKNVGQATVTITGIGTCNGSVRKTFLIRPKSTSLKKVKALRRAATVRWIKKKAQTSGYELQYSTNKNFKSKAKIKTIKRSSKSFTIKKLKKKTYYIRIRTFKKAGGERIRSSWSKAKKIKVK